MNKTRNRRETDAKKCVKFIISLLGVVLLFFPILVLAQASTSTESLNVSVTIVEEIPIPPPPPGVSWPPVTKVIFEGRAYPLAFLTFLKNGKVAATFFAQDSGLFEKELTGFEGGRYTFGIWAEDTDGRKSVTLSFTIDILEGTTTRISGIFIPPTIEIFPTQVERGQEVDIFGQSFPGSEVQIFISPKEIVEKTKTSQEGRWLFALDTTSLEEGEYEVKAKAFYGDGEQSLFSQTLSFLVIPLKVPICWGADLNFDGEVNIIDFSILLYFWGETDPENRCADINFDGIVDIFDFSIMMYWWTG
ncbi:MAG: dockerin type I repeat-containing protein [Candidatus Aminicenantia bacterium]